MPMSSHFMVTGLPGCGKTTLVQRVVEQLGKSYDLASMAAGFTTEEVLGPRGRDGFDVVSLNGKRAPLSRKEETYMSTSSSQRLMPRIGRYLVDVPSFESVALPELIVQPQVKLMIIDEIGKMEFYSEPFLNAVRQVLDSHCVVLGVIPQIKEGQYYPRENPLQSRGRSFVREIRERSDVQLVVVTRNNREGLVRSLPPDIIRSLSAKE